MTWACLSVLIITIAIVHPSVMTWGLWLFFVVRLCFLEDKHLLKRLLLLQCIVVGIICGNLRMHQSSLSIGDQTLTAVISPNQLTINGNQLKGVAVVKRPLVDEKVQIFYRLKSEAEQQAFKNNGDSWHVRLQGEIEVPEGPRNFGGFNYQNYLRSKQIERIMQVKRLTIIKSKRGLIALIHRWHQQLVHRTAAISAPLVRVYSQSLFLNVREEMALERLADYQTIGMIYLFSISGFHVSLLVGLLQRGLLRVGLIKEHVNMLSIISLFIYSVMIGWPYGMLRVTGDYLFQWMSDRFLSNRTINPLVGTLCSMSVVLLFHPMALLSISFQLSYVLALALRYSSQFQVKAGSFRTSWLCFLANLPFMLYYYQRFSWLSVIVGPLYIWLFSYLLIPGLLVVWIGHLFGISGFLMPLQLLMTRLIQVVETISQWLANLDLFNPVTGILPWWLWIILFISMFYYFDQESTQKMRKHAVKWLIVLFSWLTFLPFLNPFGQVAMIDIGQGDTFLIILPFYRGAYLIDAAARGQFKTEPWQERQSASVFDRMIAPALRA